MKSHFSFSQGQRNGIFLLLLLIIAVQLIYVFVEPKPTPQNSVHTALINDFQKEIDSLKLIKLEEAKPKVYPFNPNYITDYKGYTLGMTNEEIDRLHAFRAKNKWVNSAKEFQQVTKVSDSLLNEISPFFKFPDWVTNPKPKFGSKKENITKNYGPKSFKEKIDLNKATAEQLKRVNGIGDILSERIIRFRNKFPGGFIADVQLKDVYGISPEVLERVLNSFTVKTPRQIQKINLNTADQEALVTIQHVDYELAAEIIDQRILREGFKSLDELLKVNGFPADKFEIISLYLILEK